MTAEIQQDNQQSNSKEFNFRKQEKALIDKYEAILAQERAEKERLRQEAQRVNEPEEEDDEPYVHKNKLEKKLAHFGQQTQKQTQNEIQSAIKQAIREERKENWLKNNADFYDVLQHAEKLALADPDLADSILEMPESFERQKLVYKNIKALGLHKPPVKEKTIQDKIEENKRSPYYQPSNMGNAGFTSQSDFSPSGQKAAYEKMQELKSRLRIA